MADELSVQRVRQDQPSAAPYVGTAGLLGGAAAAGTGYYVSQPEYSSWEDILKKSKDKFEKSEGDSEEVKAFKEDATKLHEANDNLGSEYDTKEKAFVDEKTKTVKEQLDPKYQQAVDAANKDLEAKKADALQKEIARITAEENKKPSKPGSGASVEDTIRKIEERLNRKREQIRAPYEKINNYIAAGDRGVGADGRVILSEVETELARNEANVKNIKNIENILKSNNAPSQNVTILVEDGKGNFVEKGITVGGKNSALTQTQRNEAFEFIEKSKKAVAKQHDMNLKKIGEGTPFEGMFNIKDMKPADRHALAEEVQRKIIDTRTMNESAEAMTNGFKRKVAELETTAAERAEAYAARRRQLPLITRHFSSGRFTSRIWENRAIDIHDKSKIAELNKEVKKLKLAESVQKLNNYAIRDGQFVVRGTGEQVGGMFSYVMGSDINFTATAGRTPLTVAEQEEVRQLRKSVNGLRNVIKEELGDKATTEQIDKKLLEALREAESADVSALAGKEAELSTLETAYNKRKELVAKEGSLRKELDTAIGKGYTVEKDAAGNVTRILKADGTEFKADPKVKFFGKINTPTVEMSQADLKAIEDAIANQQGGKLTAEQIEAKARENIKARKFAEQEKALADANKALETAKANLKDIPGMTEEAAKAEFLKAEGVKDKTEWIQNALKKQGEELKTNHAKSFEPKWNWLKEGKNWKLAALGGAGLLGGALIGKLIAPSSEA